VGGKLKKKDLAPKNQLNFLIYKLMLVFLGTDDSVENTIAFGAPAQRLIF